MRACYSGRVFVRAVPRYTQQAFLESMVLGLEHFGGVFGEISCDYVALNIIAADVRGQLAARPWARTWKRWQVKKRT